MTTQIHFDKLHIYFELLEYQFISLVRCLKAQLAPVQATNS